LFARSKNGDLSSIFQMKNALFFIWFACLYLFRQTEKTIKRLLKLQVAYSAK